MLRGLGMIAAIIAYLAVSLGVIVLSVWRGWIGF